jgi:hypothetical protein
LPCNSLGFQDAFRRDFVKTVANAAARIGPGCCAEVAAGLDAVELLDAAIDLRPPAEPCDAFDDEFGLYRTSDQARVVRATGYLARLLMNAGREAEADEYVMRLRELLRQSSERTLVVAAVTALGYLGDWPIVLAHLGPGEPWLHQAARNVFTHWVPEAEREAALRRIGGPLDTAPHLHPEARSTLLEIVESLELRAGRDV